MTGPSGLLLRTLGCLALAALVLDERPRLRIAGVRPITTDPAGHPLAVSAVVPFVAALAWLTSRFFATGAAAGLPEAPSSTCAVRSATCTAGLRAG